jgi:hypothetical protein
MSSTCGHSECFRFIPPTLAFIVENFPTITPNQDLDRSVPRCKLCDLIAAQERADYAEMPSPTYTSSMIKITNDIKDAQQLIDQDIRKEELQKALVVIKQKREDAIVITDLKIAAAWKEHWAIWGPGDGPDREDDETIEPFDFVEGLEAVGVGETVGAVEAVVEKKPKPSPKKKGRASRKK